MPAGHSSWQSVSIWAAIIDRLGSQWQALVRVGPGVHRAPCQRPQVLLSGQHRGADATVLALWSRAGAGMYF